MLSRFAAQLGQRRRFNFRLFRPVEETFYVQEPSFNNLKLWRGITFFFALPAVALCMGNAWWQQRKMRHDEKPHYVNYEYLGRHNHRFPWGDGTKSLFFNSKVNYHAPEN